VGDAGALGVEGTQPKINNRHLKTGFNKICMIYSGMQQYAADIRAAYCLDGQ
jgi:hypothetical protein